MSKIGSTEALEKYLQLECENEELIQELKIYKSEIEKLRKAYSDLASGIGTLFEWLENKDQITACRRMAEIFKFAYMEAHFEDMRAKWTNAQARETAARTYPTLVTGESSNE